jgi:hypothetical protein
LAVRITQAAIIAAVNARKPGIDDVATNLSVI